MVAKKNENFPFHLSVEQQMFEASVRMRVLAMSRVEARKRLNDAEAKLHEAFECWNKRLSSEGGVGGE